MCATYKMASKYRCTDKPTTSIVRDYIPLTIDRKDSHEKKQTLYRLDQ